MARYPAAYRSGAHGPSARSAGGLSNPVSPRVTPYAPPTTGGARLPALPVAANDLGRLGGSRFALGFGRTLGRFIPGIGIALTAYELWQWFNRPPVIVLGPWTAVQTCGSLGVDGWRAWSAGQTCAFWSFNCTRNEAVSTLCSNVNPMSTNVGSSVKNIGTYHRGAYVPNLNAHQWTLEVGYTRTTTGSVAPPLVQPGIGYAMTSPPGIFYTPFWQPLSPENFPADPGNWEDWAAPPGTQPDGDDYAYEGFLSPTGDPFRNPTGDPATNPETRPERAPERWDPPRPPRPPLPPLMPPVVLVPPTVPPAQPPETTVEAEVGSTNPPTVRHNTTTQPPKEEPPKRKKERKINVRTVAGGVWAVINLFTESLDFLDVLWKSLPDDARTKMTRNNKTGEWYNVTYADKMMDLYDSWEDIDIAAAVTNYLNNAVEDRFWATGSKGVKDLSRKANLSTGLDKALRAGNDIQYDKAYQGNLLPELTYDRATGQFGMKWDVWGYETKFNDFFSLPSKQIGDFVR